MTTEEQLREMLTKANHTITSHSIKLDGAERKIQALEEMNQRLSDRNWELQKRIFECSNWPVK